RRAATGTASSAAQARMRPARFGQTPAPVRSAATHPTRDGLRQAPSIFRALSDLARRADPAHGRSPSLASMIRDRLPLEDRDLRVGLIQIRERALKAIRERSVKSQRRKPKRRFVAQGLPVWRGSAFEPSEPFASWRVARVPFHPLGVHDNEARQRLERILTGAIEPNLLELAQSRQTRRLAKKGDSVGGPHVAPQPPAGGV